MKKLFAIACFLISGMALAGNPYVVIETSMGNIELELDEGKAPVTVKNFLTYVESDFFKNTIFHRVIPGFMIQGGGFEQEMVRKETQAPIKNEASNGLANARGTIAMARTNDPNSATSQFFINLVDNPFLDHKDTSPKGYGYAVFGKVTKGLEVVDKIGAVKTTGNKGNPPDKPLEDVVIQTVIKL